MEIEKSRLKDAFLIKPRIHGDKRGYFIEAFNSKKFKLASGLDIHFIQDNESGSRKGSLRGLHFQKPPYNQAKLVRVVKGTVQDIIVDLRASSPTFGKWESYILSEENKHQLFVPHGFAHAFLTLSDFAIFQYKVDNIYHPASDSGISWNDNELGIQWNLEAEDLIISEKDASLQSFQEYRENPDFH